MARTAVFAILAALFMTASCRKNAEHFSDLTYFTSAAQSSLFNTCKEPKCSTEIGKAKWTRTRGEVFTANTGVRIPRLYSTTKLIDVAPGVVVAGKDVSLQPAQPRTDGLASSRKPDISRVEPGITLDEFYSQDVPCVSHAGCWVDVIAVGGRWISATYSICYRGPPEDDQTVTKEVAKTARDNQDGRLPLLGEDRNVSDEVGWGYDYTMTTHVHFDSKLLVGVNMNDHVSQVADGYYGACVNTFVVTRNDLTEPLFKAYEEVNANARRRDAEMKSSTVPH